MSLYIMSKSSEQWQAETKVMRENGDICDMRENVNGFIYDLLDGGDICDVCGEHYHNCEPHTEEEMELNIMHSLYVLQTSEQDLATGGLEFTCCFEAEKAYFEAYVNSPKDGGFASLIQVDPSNKNASGYSQKTIRQYQTGIYNNR